MQMCLRPSLCAAAELLLLLPPVLCEGWRQDPPGLPPAVPPLGVQGDGYGEVGPLGGPVSPLVLV